MAYYDFISAVNTYYENPDTWQEIMSHIVTGSSAEVSEYLKNTPYVDYTLLNDGRIGDYYVVNVLDGFNQSTDIGNVINSNSIPSIGSTSMNVGIPSVISKSTTTGNFSGVSGIGLTADTGVTATGVLSTIGVSLGAVGMGALLGKDIGRALYESNPSAWDSGVLKGLSNVDWNNFTVSLKNQLQEGILGLFGINGDTTTMYLDENFASYMAWYYSQNLLNGVTFPSIPSEENPLVISSTYATMRDTYNYALSTSHNTFTFDNDTLNEINTYISLRNDKICAINIRNNTEIASGGWSPLSIYTLNDDVVGQSISQNPTSLHNVSVLETYGSGLETINITKTRVRTQTLAEVYIGGVFLVNSINHLSSINTNIGTTGITENPSSKQFDPAGVGSVATALGALKNQYPELWDKSIKKSVPQEDGTEDEHVYIPIPIPKFNGAFDTQPTTGTPSQSDPSISPDTTPDDELNNASNTIAPPSTPTDDPNTGGGNSPSIVVPSQQASALWAIYNPSLAQLNQLGAWLWSTNFIDQILKIFNDPMQAIIGLHKVYTTPNISGTGNIKVGYLDSGVGSNIVGNQYTYIDCGTVSLREYYGNILDYSPYTTVQLYLPFIGIVPLDVADVTRSSVSVKYGVDVLTGACLASVSVQRDNAGGVLYQYSGNCACQYPLSSGSYMGMVTGAIGAVGSLAKGNIFGTALSIAGMHTTIEHSGGFSGNAGAMGGKKPYLIVSRPQTAMNDGFPAIQGYPSNVFVILGSCTGYVQVADCHVENIPATDKELEKIKQLLKEGVIL